MHHTKTLIYLLNQKTLTIAQFSVWLRVFVNDVYVTLLALECTKTL